MILDFNEFARRKHETKETPFVNGCRRMKRDSAVELVKRLEGSQSSAECSITYNKIRKPKKG